MHFFPKLPLIALAISTFLLATTLRNESVSARRIAQSQDVQWLEKIASSEKAAEELHPSGRLSDSAKDYRSYAYARLGELGTKESLAAVQRIEEIAHQVAPAPSRVTLGVWAHPAWHCDDEGIKPLVTTKATDGTTYALIVSHLLGDIDIFLMSTRTPENKSSWSRPKLIPNRIYLGIQNPQLSSPSPGILLFSFLQTNPPPHNLMDGTRDESGAFEKAPAHGKQEWTISVAEIEKDSDSDGWTDIEEARLGLDASKADTDGDGVPDGLDVCPNYAATPGDEKDEDVQIIQKAFFAAFGLSGSRTLLLVSPDVRKVELWGYGGPVIYGVDPQRWRKEHQPGAVFVSWKITKKNAAQATLELMDYEGPLAAGGQEISLRKVGLEWFVTKRMPTWVS